MVPMQHGTAVGRALSRAELVEAVLLHGDLKKLTSDERVSHYLTVCQSLGLNPATKPFDYLELNGKLILYANKGCSEQLRDKHQISFSAPRIDIDTKASLIMVSVTGTNSEGRTDTDIGAVPLPGGGEARANAIMKAITKAKRRCTLSLCGLGMLDESERDTIPGARTVTVDPDTGEILDDGKDAKSDARLVRQIMARLGDVMRITDHEEAKALRCEALEMFKAAIHETGGPGRIREHGSSHGAIIAKLTETLEHVRSLKDKPAEEDEPPEARQAVADADAADAEAYRQDEQDGGAFSGPEYDDVGGEPDESPLSGDEEA